MIMVHTCVTSCSNKSGVVFRLKKMVDVGGWNKQQTFEKKGEVREENIFIGTDIKPEILGILKKHRL